MESNKLTQQPQNTQSETAEIEYKDGVFLLSDPGDVHKLVRNMQGRITEFDSIKAPAQSGSGISIDNKDFDFSRVSDRFQSIETKLQQHAAGMAKNIQLIMQNVAALRQAIEKHVSEQQQAEFIWQGMLQEQEDQLREIVRVMIEQQLNRQQSVEKQWRQQMEGRIEKMIDFMQAKLDNKKEDSQQTSWFYQLFGSKSKT